MVSQLRQEATQWKEQCLRLEETSSSWKEQFVRVEQERLKLSEQLDKLISVRSSFDPNLTASSGYALLGD